VKFTLHFTSTLSPILVEDIKKSVFANMGNSNPKPRTSLAPDVVFPSYPHFAGYFFGYSVKGEISFNNISFISCT
jgi:hypothetical protein